MLSRTAEGIAYRGFARMLSSSEEAETIRRDIDQVLTGGFAREHMSPSQREILDSMFSALLTAQLQVEQSYLRWTTSLRRIVTRAAHGRHARLISVAALALEAAAEWVDSNPADLADAWDCGGLPGASSCGNQAARRVLRTHSPGRIHSASGLAAAARDVRFGGRRAARPRGPSGLTRRPDWRRASSRIARCHHAECQDWVRVNARRAAVRCGESWDPGARSEGLGPGPDPR